MAFEAVCADLTIVSREEMLCGVLILGYCEGKGGQLLIHACVWARTHSWLQVRVDCSAGSPPIVVIVWMMRGNVKQCIYGY